MQTFSFDFALNLLPLMLKYLHVTLSMSILSLFLGLFIAIIITLITENKIKILYPIVKVYVSFFRGTPLIAQLFFLYFGLVQIFPSLKGMNGFTTSIIGLSLNSSAYMSETIRGAISSVDKGQMEACLSVGMTYLQAMRRIILPQAARVAIPALSNNFIDIIKGSSLAFTLGVTELMATAQMEGASAYRFFEAFTDVIIIYWSIISLFEYLQKKLELIMNKAY
ncbi:amino acid ABC transporter membrane protein, PAAT family (TC 3.A.1.3.-) [Caminicella sporogenes DSM 14501]|uniref:Amino acid ABC transporter membrane protein, PAAT family (TC 3.A.1.3.-) n=1 Tax=Caminicella sporogenes DSM 14501 TaxID=1121266 RepID=A0A1M6TLL0_9FIRM|nr:amino acid ABC transporter permease [Caminicella sporogenes]RKD22345.1 ABC transporter permease [Caminicella sporogenes]SHK57952.1 amino acid ABC transporter membrane protein, PAAT family (TC 3.A.1.3.-) [Caminicella sporogenes DSM 14501]